MNNSDIDHTIEYENSLSSVVNRLLYFVSQGEEVNYLVTMIQGKGYFKKELTKNLKRFLSQTEIRNVSSTSKRGKMMLSLHYLKVSLSSMVSFLYVTF